MTPLPTPARLAAAAGALVGTPFRLHGRDPATGLDCVGVIAAAFAACGAYPQAPRGYALRNRSIDALLSLADGAGMIAAAGPIAPGDVVLVRPAPGQHHLLVAVEDERFVHAHAGLRRVVAQPGPLPWPIERHWRLATEET